MVSQNIQRSKEGFDAAQERVGQVVQTAIRGTSELVIRQNKEWETTFALATNATMVLQSIWMQLVRCSSLISCRC